MIKAGGEELAGSVLMGINTKEFGETARLQSGLNKEHWYNYLNDLAEVSNGVIISSNLAKKYNIKVGDSINYARYSPIKGKEKEEIASPSGTVCAIVDAFPDSSSMCTRRTPMERWRKLRDISSLQTMRML